MITNTPVTLYNAYYNKDTGLTEWNKTVISAVNWQGTNKSTVGDKGLNSKEIANIYIPLTSNFSNKTYVGPKEYAKLPNNKVKNHFTFSTGDKIVKGVINFEITGSKPNTVAYLEQSHDNVLTVMSIIKQDYINSMAHYHIGAQ